MTHADLSFRIAVCLAQADAVLKAARTEPSPEVAHQAAKYVASLGKMLAATEHGDRHPETEKAFRVCCGCEVNAGGVVALSHHAIAHRLSVRVYSTVMEAVAGHVEDVEACWPTVRSRLLNCEPWDAEKITRALTTENDRVADLPAAAAAPPKPDPPTGVAVPPKTRWLAEAMLLVRDHPDWSNRRIAATVDKSASSLSRSREYQAAAAMARGSRDACHRGHIVTDPDTGRRGVEAYSDDPAERDWD